MKREFKAGETLFAQGEPASHLFVLESGNVRLFRRAWQEDVLLETVGDHHVLGELAILADAHHPVTAIAVSDVVCLTIPRDTLKETLEAYPEIAARFQHNLALRLANAYHHIATMSLRSPLARVLSQLQHEMIRSGLQEEANGYAPLPADLHEVCGLEEVVVERILRGLGEEGAVEFNAEGRFRFRDPAAIGRRLHYLELSDRFGADA